MRRSRSLHDEAHVTVRLTRREIEIPLADGTSFPTLLVSPPAPTGVVLVVHDLFGRRPLYEDLAAEIAAHGFEVVLPDFFHELGPLPEPTIADAVARRRRLDERATFERFRSVVEWLRARPGHVGRVGTVGFCMGGTFALDLGAYERDLATVSFYGFPRPQPELAFPPPAPLDLVERLEGPILAIWGEDDDQVGMEHVEEFARRCRAAGRTVEFRILPGLGHSFLTSLPADERLQALARQAWREAIEHLRTHVGSPALLG
jgi:carboxymethylenebutenolidase